MSLAASASGLALAATSSTMGGAASTSSSSAPPHLAGTASFLSDAHSALSAGRNAGQFVGGDEPTGTQALVQERTSSAKDTFFAKAREMSRQRQVSESGVFATSGKAGASSLSASSSSVNQNNSNNNAAAASAVSMATSFVGAAASAAAASHNSQQYKDVGSGSIAGATESFFSKSFGAQTEGGRSSTGFAERRAQIVRNVVEGSSVFNVDASSQRVGFAVIGGGVTYDPRGSVSTFTGANGRVHTLHVLGDSAEPMMEHIDRQRETALLAALEASRSRTANETRQADAAAMLQSFFRMAVQRRRYLRHKLTVSKQLRAIDKLRCCKAAMLLSRFCRGHMVRREYRAHRWSIAERRLENMTRRSKIERPGTAVMMRVPPTSLVLGHNCTQEEWVLDVLARYNHNFVNGVRCMAAGNYGEAISYFDAHIKSSTVSAKEQSNEFLTTALLSRCFAALPAHIAAELAAANAKGRGRR